MKKNDVNNRNSRFAKGRMRMKLRHALTSLGSSCSQHLDLLKATNTSISVYCVCCTYL